MKPYFTSEIRNLLNPAKNILIALPHGANFDNVAAGSALYLSLLKSGKQVEIVCPEQMRVEFSRLVGVDKISDKMSGSDMLMIFNYPIENIDRVSSNDEGGKLNLVVKVKAGQMSISPQQIIFSSTGANGDLIFTVGAKELASLGKVYQDNQDFLGQKPIININNDSQGTEFGRVNIIDREASCLSEMLGSLISGLGLPVDPDIGTNLILGLDTATDGFRSTKISADSFEVAAYALRAGGRRMRTETGTIGSPEKGEEEKKQVPQPQRKPSPGPSPEWLEPRIYKGSNLP